MRAMSFRQRMMVVIGLGVALPALVLAALGVFLTLRIADAVEAQSIRYSHYMAQQVVEAYETELLAHLREAVAPAENAARLDQGSAAIMAGLREGTREFTAPDFIPLHDLSDHLLLVVQSTPLVYGEELRRGKRFAGMMLRDSEGEITGAGGWWIDPGLFLERHVQVVIEERVASNNRIYGGIESQHLIRGAQRAPKVTGFRGQQLQRCAVGASGVDAQVKGALAFGQPLTSSSLECLDLAIVMG